MYSVHVFHNRYSEAYLSLNNDKSKFVLKCTRIHAQYMYIDTMYSTVHVQYTSNCNLIHVHVHVHEYVIVDIFHKGTQTAIISHLRRITNIHVHVHVHFCTCKIVYM